MAWYDLAGTWLAIFLTLCIFSFLYEDNPAYKLAEHIFVGVSIGIVVSEQWFGTLKPNLVDRLIAPENSSRLLSVVPLVLVILLFMKLHPRHGALARIPIALMVSAFAAVKLTGEASGNLMVQVADSMPDLRAAYAEAQPDGIWNWEMDGAGIFSELFVMAGLICCLIYFFFSVPHVGPIKHLSRIGIWILMISFGASFGYTVMGRISLTYGRLLTLVGTDRPAREAAQVQAPLVTLVSIVLIALWIWIYKRSTVPPSTENSR